MSGYLVPGVICFILVYGMWKKVDVFQVFLEGAKEGFQTSLSIMPTLVALMTCVGMFKASGALDYLTHVLSPLAEVLKIPREIVPLAILRPISGSGALLIYQELLGNYGPDSYIGRVASVLEGASETTFYTVAVYFGATRVSRTRHALPAALSGDLMGFVMSAAMVRFFFGIL